MMTAPRGEGFENVLIVGAGPAGMLLALMLGQAGVPVVLIDMAAGLDQNPRATHYGPPAMYELNRAGLGDDIRQEGFLPDGVCWRKLDGTPIASIHNGAFPDDPNRMACLPLNRLGLIMQRHLEAQGKVDVRYGYKVIGIGQEETKAWVEVESPEGKQTLSASYIVGCDGANSQIRRSLFGDREFPGRTWNEQIVATNPQVPPQISSRFGAGSKGIDSREDAKEQSLKWACYQVRYNFDQYDLSDSNFIVHPEHWSMAARITRDGLWRVTYGEIPGLSNDELRQRLPEKFKAFLPGAPDPGQYEVVNFSPYKVHQRLAKQMRVGRFLLAADAAHLCNPFGGMGLTGGIVDVGGLRDCLVGIYEGKADDTILDRYNDIRRQKYLEIIDVVSTENIRRLFSTDPDRALETDDFLKMCKQASENPEVAEQMQKVNLQFYPHILN
ncbi:putative Para-nitrophenol 4-monooxygenase [Seiridium unicorne]|uniref:Para-nitrophenol 4-monooxygenase n=1 Tax=Seiridium unicorne TaxID=138068 RepID=A0ABR2VBU6_9PEZI